MAQTRETGFLRNAVQVTNQGIVFVSGSTTLMSISSSGAVTTTGVISGSNALSSSFSLNSALLSGTGSVGFATTGAFATASGSVSSRITQIEQVYATTGSNSFRATQSITGSLTVTGQIIAQTLNVQQVTSSIIFSTGSNTFGCDLNNRQTFTGSVIMTGSLTVNTSGTEFQVTNTGINFGNALTDTHNISGSLRITGSGNHYIMGCNLGIGTNSPTNKLTISNDGNSVVAFRINDTNANASFLSLNASNTDSAIIAGGTSAIPFDIYTGGCPRMRITCTGNVGIGITTPFSNAKLQVNVGANMNFAVQPGTACTTGIKLNTFVDSGASNVPLELNGNILYLKTCENSRLVINGSGISCFACQVYVGTDKLCWTDTVFKTLQVGNGAFNNTGTQTQIVNNVYYDDTNYRSLIGGPSNRLIMTGPGDLIFEYACTQAVGCIVSLSPKLFICGINGRVGMGTTTPEYPLHIFCCAPLGMKIQTCGSTFGSPSINLLNGGVDTVLTATNTGLEIGTWSANDIILRTTQVERMRINTSGIVTMPFQPSMFAQPGASMFPIGTSQTAYGWCTSGSVRYNCGFTLTSATSATCNIADAQNTGKIIMPATGRYLLQFSQRNEGQCTQDGQFFLWVNGTQRIRRHIELWNGRPYIHVDVTAILALNIGDCLEMGAWFNGTGKTDTFSGTGDQVNWMSLAKIS